MVEIRVLTLMFIRGDGPKSDKGSLRRMKMKEKTRIYLLEVSDIGRKTMLKLLWFAQNGETVKRRSEKMVKCQKQLNGAMVKQ